MAGALREVFARFGIEVDDTKLKSADHAVNGFAEKLEKVGKVLVGGLIVRELTHFVHGLAEQGTAIFDNARKIGLSTDAYQAMGFAAKISGVDIETMTLAIQSLQDKMVDAATKGGESAKAFKALGVSVKDSHGNLRDTQEVFKDSAEAISKIQDPARQTAATMDLFGRAGKRMLPFLKEGREGIEKLTKEFEELGGGFSKEAAEASDEFDDALYRNQTAIDSVRGKIAQVLLPVLQKVVEVVTKAISWFARLAKHTYLVEVALGVLGTVLAAFAIKAAVALSPLLAPFILWGIIIGGLILLIEDLYVWFKGGKSVIGEWLQALLGAEQAKAVLENVRDVVKGISGWIAQTARDFRDFLQWVDEALTKLSALIGLKNAALAKGNSEDDRQAIRRSAAKAGQTVRFPGETPEEAAAGNARAQAEMQTARQLQSGARSAVAFGSNVINQVFNTGASMDEEKLARLARQEAEKAHVNANQAAAQALTREAPAK